MLNSHMNNMPSHWQNIKQNILIKSSLWSLFMCIITTIAIFSYDCMAENRFDSQFSGRKDKYPNQLFNTFTNYAFSIAAGVTFAQIRWKRFWLYLPFFLLGCALMITGTSSSLFHASTNCKPTGNWDVSSILPTIIFVFWLIFSGLSLIVFQKFYYDTWYKVFTWVFNSIVLIIAISVFIIHYEDEIEIDWDDKMFIFFVSIAALVISGAVLFLVATGLQCYKDRKTGLSLDWVFHIKMLFGGLAAVGILTGISFIDEDIEHGIIRHINTAFMITIIVFFSRVVYVSIDTVPIPGSIYQPSLI